jgi:FdhD protein
METTTQGWTLPIFSSQEQGAGYACNMSSSPAPNSSKQRTASAAEGSLRAQILRWRVDGKARRRSDLLAREEPLEIRVQGRSVAVTMRTPGDDEDLAAGFLVSEGVIRRRSEVTGIAPCQAGSASDQGNVLNVFLAPSVEVKFERLTRHVFASSSCGLCGKGSIESVHQHFAPVDCGLVMAAGTIARLPERLRRAQCTFAKTGGLHAAGIFEAQGKLVVAREDVGRHNAVDKVVGHGLREGCLPFDKHVLVVSGRASFEIMQKALAAGIGVVCAVSAPSSLAVEFARESGQTLLGFVRGGSMNVYAGAERIGTGQKCVDD